MTNSETQNENIVVEVADVNTPLDTANNASEKKPTPLVPIIAAIGGAIALVLILVVVFVFVGKGNAIGYGEKDTLAQIKVTINDNGDSAPDIDHDSLSKITGISTESGALLAKGTSDQTVEAGKQININYFMFAYATEDMISSAKMEAFGNSDGHAWTELQNSWSQGGQSVPITVTDKKASDSGDLGGIVGEDSSADASSSASNSVEDHISELVNGQPLGSVIALFTPPEASASAQGQGYIQLIIAQVIHIGDVGEDINTPKASTDVPENAPVVALDDAGKPSVTVPEGYTGTDEVVVKVIQEGTGDVIGSQDAVTVQYAGWLTDGTEFDSSYSHGTEPTQFSLQGVVPGWRAGLAGQKVGSKVEILIPSKYGYGEKGSGEKIPANANLIFYVDIVSSMGAQEYQAQQQAQQQQQGGAGAN